MRQTSDSEIKIDNQIETDTHRYVSGKVTSFAGMRFVARISDRPKPDGLNEDRMDQLVIMENNKTIARYNHGWEMKPQTIKHNHVVLIVRDELNYGQVQSRSRPRISFTQSEPHPLPDMQDRDIAGIVIDKGHPTRDLWQHGRIINMPGYSFCAKVYDAPSGHGISNGTISKLEVRKDGEIVMNYDRGWDMPPQSPEHREAVQRIRNGLGDRSERIAEVPNRGPDKAHSIDR